MCPIPESSVSDIEKNNDAFHADLKYGNSSAAAAAATASTSSDRPSSWHYKVIMVVLGIFGFIIVVQLASLIALGAKMNNQQQTTVPNIIINNGGDAALLPSSSDAVFLGADIPSQIVLSGENICAGAKPDLPNIPCIVDAIVNTNLGPQSGANVTKGYNGTLETNSVPIPDDYYLNGQYDENGNGPNGNSYGPQRRLAGEDTQAGFRCKHYNSNDPKFTKPYNWKHCVGMEVGETYEVHWPHSAAGACGTPNQYQTPFYDGVFCMIDNLDLVTPDATAQQIGVQAQVFTIVNDEKYYYPDLMRGMIKDGEYGADIARYTGSTTGSSVNNDNSCSSYSPITWQVDRQCHLISASTFDKMCYDMKSQRDDMSDDLYAHGSRELVADELAANNHARKLLNA